MKRLFVIMSVLVCLFVPRVALAEEVDILGGFTSGLSDFASDEVRTVEVSPESEFADEYEPVLREVDSAELVESDNPIDDVVQQVWLIPWAAGKSDMIFSIKRFFVTSLYNGMFVAAIAIVFLWWGVRKTVRIVFESFRRGNASV